MKGLIGILIIYIMFIVTGLLMNTWPFKHGFEGLYIFIIAYSILFFLLFLSARIVNRYKNITGIITFIIWILISTIYGIVKMKDDYDLFISDNWNKFFGWEFALWEAGIPLYIGIPQIIFIVCHVLIRVYLDAPNYKNKIL
jgi:hypothetical protein